MILPVLLALMVPSPVLLGIDALGNPAAADGWAGTPAPDSPEAVWEQVKTDSKNAWDEAPEVSQQAWGSARDESAPRCGRRRTRTPGARPRVDPRPSWLGANQQSQAA